MKVVEDLIDEAARAEERAENLLKSGDYSGALEAAQHCIEHSIKAMYRLAGLSPPTPKSHDVGIELDKVMGRLQFSPYHQYLKQDVARMRFISTMWAWAHSTSVYGCLDTPASKVFKEKDAKNALDYASEILNNCQILLNLVRLDQLKIKMHEEAQEST